MSGMSRSGATRSHDAASGGLSVSAPTSKYTARRVKVAALRMRSARPFVENAGAPSASTVCSSKLSKVTPSANRSRVEASETSAETSPSSPSSRRWIRRTVTSRFPRMVSSMPAKYPSPPLSWLASAETTAATEPFAPFSISSPDAPASHAVSPASTRARVSSARAASARASASAGSFLCSPFPPPASASSANPATTWRSSMSTITGFFPSARQGTRRVSRPTTPARTRNGSPSALSASTLSLMFVRTTSPLNTATFKSSVLMPCTYDPSTWFSTPASLDSNIARVTRRARRRRARRADANSRCYLFPDEICERGGVDARARVARTGARASFFGAIARLPPRVANVLDAARAARRVDARRRASQTKTRRGRGSAFVIVSSSAAAVQTGHTLQE